MIIIIDGYNVLKQNLHQQEISEAEKQRFITQLVTYNAQKNHAILVVFDGGPYWNPDVESIGTITVVYSGTKQSADDYIMHYLDAHKTQDLLLVSTDRALCTHAWNLSIESMDADDFYRLLQSSLANIKKIKHAHPTIVKLTEANTPELDALMYEASQQKTPQKEPESGSPHTQRSGKTRSKTERRMLKKIKKL